MSNVTLLDSGNYSLLVTNAVGCSVSAAGLLTVVDVQPFHFEHLEITASQFKFRFVGEAFRVYWFEASTNLVNWAELFGTFSGQATLDLIISNDGQPWRFIRARTDP